MLSWENGIGGVRRRRRLYGIELLEENMGRRRAGRGLLK